MNQTILYSNSLDNELFSIVKFRTNKDTLLKACLNLSSFSDFVMFNLLRHKPFSLLERLPLNLRLECHAKFQNQIHLSAGVASGEFRDLLNKPEHRPKPSSKFPGFAPIFISPHIRTIQFVCRFGMKGPWNDQTFFSSYSISGKCNHF